MQTDLVFYGTGAAEGIPSPFCRCDVCENARQVGGAERRRRSQFRVDRRVMIDLGPDTVASAMDHGDLRDLEHVLITHTHEDHFYYGLLETRALSSPPPAHPLNVYLVGEAYDVLADLRNTQAVMRKTLPALEKKGIVAFHRLAFGEEYALGNLRVTPLRGNHTGNMGENAANYLLTLADGRMLYYGVDTGWYLEETLEALAGRQLDILISECTWGARSQPQEKPDRHLDFGSCMRLLEALYERDTITANTQVYLTHINHKHPATHAVLCRMAVEAGTAFPLTIAWDGCAID